MSFMNDRLLVTLGARQQTIWSRGYDYNTGAAGENYQKTKLTPMAGVVFKASPQVSVYANYSEALQKGERAPMTAANAGTVSAPYVSEQKEIGVKYDGGKFGGALSLFTVSKASGYVDASNIFVTDGEQRNRGVEVSAFGELQRGLRVLGGLTLLDAEMIKSGTPANDGKDAIGVPDTMVNLGIEWDVPGIRGLSLNGRAVYTSSQFADGANTLELPSWTRFDLGARYLTTVGNKLVTWRARIDNVADRDYWASAGGYPGSNYLVLGAPRTFVLSASIEF
jgi:iron complex outermembrane receptor protein